MQLYKRIFEATPDGMLVVGRDGVVIDANAQASAMFGYAPRELIGQPVELLVPDHFKPGHVEHRTGYASDLRARRMGERMTLAGRRKDGSELPIEPPLNFEWVAGDNPRRVH